MIALTSPGSNKLLHSLGGFVVVMVGMAEVVAFAGAMVGAGATSVTVGTGGRFVGFGDEAFAPIGSMVVVAFAGAVVGVGGAAGIVTSGTWGRGGRVAIGVGGAVGIVTNGTGGRGGRVAIATVGSMVFPVWHFPKQVSGSDLLFVQYFGK
jgi:hypothetical protein